MNHLLTMGELTNSQIYGILNRAEMIQNNPIKPMDKQYFVANLFFEPSTRTKMSFEVAERKLGIEILNFSTDSSSVQKGESLLDTVKTMEAIGASAVVIRHPYDRYYRELQDKVAIPIINGGDGKGEHPTQCLLDLLTIYQEFGRFEGLKIVIAGDLLHSRVARSNAHTLKKLGASVYLSGPAKWHDETLSFPFVSIDKAVEMCDCLMLLRIQHERHDHHEDASGNSYHQAYGLTVEREKRMKKSSIILHPAPVNRGVEIADELIDCDRSRIFKQMTNGVAVRMAILQQLLSKGGNDHVDSINQRKTI